MPVMYLILFKCKLFDNFDSVNDRRILHAIINNSH